MTTENELFQSRDNFDDVDVNEAPTTDDIYTRSFESAASDDTDKVIEVSVPANHLIAGMTDDELKVVLGKAKRFDELDERLTKTHDTAFGRMGNLEQQFRELQQTRLAAVTPSQLSVDSFKSLNDYFGDTEIGTALANDLAQLQLGSSQVTHAGIDEQRYSNDIAQMRNDFEEKLVSVVHPDWREIKTSQDFGDWYGSLDQRSQAVIASSYKSEDVTRALTSYKTWRDQKVTSQQQKQARLENALPLPSGGGRNGRQASTSYEDAFNQGMKNARR